MTLIRLIIQSIDSISSSATFFLLDYNILSTVFLKTTPVNLTEVLTVNLPSPPPQLADFLADGVLPSYPNAVPLHSCIRLNTTVTAIDYSSPTRVILSTIQTALFGEEHDMGGGYEGEETSIEADAVFITVPLGVLKASIGILEPYVKEYAKSR